MWSKKNSSYVFEYSFQVVLTVFIIEIKYHLSNDPIFMLLVVSSNVVMTVIKKY